jgi:hypothetical protein
MLIYVTKLEGARRFIPKLASWTVIVVVSALATQTLILSPTNRFGKKPPPEIFVLLSPLKPREPIARC